MRLLHHLLDHENDSKTAGFSSKIRERKKKTKATRGKRRNIILVGHSLGGRCALNTFYYFPQSFSGLVLVNPSLFTDNASVPGFSPNLIQQTGFSFLKLVPSLTPPRIAYYDYDAAIDEEMKMNYQQVFHDWNWKNSLQLWSQHHFSEPGLSPERVLLRVNIPSTYYFKITPFF